MADEVLDLMNWDEPEQELDRLAYLVIGAAIEVHRILGPGFLERVYHRALLRELRMRGVRCESEVPVVVTYKGENVGEGSMDIVVEGKLLLEIKAVDTLLPVHSAQVISYLKASGLKLGLLINFHGRTLKDGVRRIVHSN